MDKSYLPEEVLTAANQLGGWLAQNDFTGQPDIQDTQLIVMAGNAVMPTIDAACRLASENGGTLLISGGIGHSTDFLYQAIAQHPCYCSLSIEGQPEARLLAEIAHRFWHIPRERIVVEDLSTNCGENAWFTRRTLVEKGIHVQRATVVQDPTMQRRTMATFDRVWQEESDAPEWLSYPGYQPVLENTAKGVSWRQPAQGLWPVARYLALIIGELPRLRDNAEGYGPRGKGFIAHVDIPDEIEAAWLLLSADPHLQPLLASRHLS
ncbi:YdcF family protein [Kluyvera intermedia]|uniref:ElyC/SanA/YdcF family protein n=1 Tax=Kluyvera intermedia TaxID=61648 RepID=A0AA95G1I9_KLUIN|nr:ElyC/SanA/YdcF family protein [Kluyvera intermedia]WGL54314.1 ElyC/SanA/YdcF family protein [Kluyvera intermedia]